MAFLDAQAAEQLAARQQAALGGGPAGGKAGKQGTTIEMGQGQLLRAVLKAASGANVASPGDLQAAEGAGTEGADALPLLAPPEPQPAAAEEAATTPAAATAELLVKKQPADANATPPAAVNATAP